MVGKPRKGAFASRADGQELQQLAETPAELSVVAAYGHGRVETANLNLAAFTDIPIIINNTSAVRRLAANKAPATLATMRGNLSEIAKYVTWYGKRYEAAPSAPEEVSARFTHQFIAYQFERETAEETKSIALRYFKRFLLEIGVERALLPPNPFRSNGTDVPRDTLSHDEANLILNRAKLEIRVIRRRACEAHRFAAAGKDPRLAAGGAVGDWSRPENRAWVIKRLLKRELHTFDDLRFKLGFRTVLAGLEKFQAAEVITADGSITRLGGFNGHLRWFFPWADDLASFAALMMLRTGWNLTTVANLQSRRWCKPYPYRLGSTSAESHVYIVSTKVRGRKDAMTVSKVESFPSARRPHSHPYRLLKTVEYLTAGLRREIYRKRSELMMLSERIPRQESELQRLEEIKDDLFIFKTEQGISSYRWVVAREETVEEVSAFFRRAGVSTTTRQLRDAALVFSYEASGQNLFVTQILANHSDRNTTALYLRRKKTLDRIWRDAIRIFDSSLQLIEQGKFGVTALREALASQGFGSDQVNNLLDPQTTTRWGNRCADPKHPPRGFDRQAKGGACRTQDCIDGCPYARWFSDSIEHVARHLVSAERLLAKLGTESTEGSSLLSRVDRCRLLLSRWSEHEREKAIMSAHQRSSDDLFLGPAL